MPIYLEDDCCQCDQNENFTGSDSEMPDCMYGRPFENWPIAMAYVPFQPWEETYEPEQAMEAGTIFPSLNLPFLGGMQR